MTLRARPVEIVATTIGVARLGIYLPEALSLKDKRKVVRSLSQRVRDRFNVAVAEVEDLDDMRVATLALACVSNSAPHADQMLATVIAFIDRTVEIGALAEIQTELIPFGD